MTHAQNKKSVVRSARTFELFLIEIYRVVLRVQNAFRHRSPVALVEADVWAMAETQLKKQCGADGNIGTCLERELSHERNAVGTIKTRSDLRQSKVVIVTADFDDFGCNCIYRFRKQESIEIG